MENSEKDPKMDPDPKKDPNGILDEAQISNIIKRHMYNRVKKHVKNVVLIVV